MLRLKLKEGDSMKKINLAGRRRRIVGTRHLKGNYHRVSDSQLGMSEGVR